MNYLLINFHCPVRSLVLSPVVFIYLLTALLLQFTALHYIVKPCYK